MLFSGYADTSDEPDDDQLSLSILMTQSSMRKLLTTLGSVQG